MPPVKGVAKSNPCSWDSPAPASWCPGHRDLPWPRPAQLAMGTEPAAPAWWDGLGLPAAGGRELAGPCPCRQHCQSPAWHSRLMPRMPQGWALSVLCPIPQADGGPWQGLPCATGLWGPSEQQLHHAEHQGFPTYKCTAPASPGTPQQGSDGEGGDAEWRLRLDGIAAYAAAICAFSPQGELGWEDYWGMLDWALHCSQLPSPPQPSVTLLQHSGGHSSRGRDDQHGMAIRTQDVSGMALLGHGG